MKKNILYLAIAISVAGNIIFAALFLMALTGFSFGGMMDGRSYSFFQQMMDHRYMEHMEEEHQGQKNKKTSPGQPFAETHKSIYDFGRISKKDGIVKTVFEIENEGEGALQIGNISSSCGCTSAEIDRKNIPAGEKAHLIVSFDPNFHEEPKGRFKRSIFVKTNDPQNPEMKFDIFIDIIESKK